MDGSLKRSGLKKPEPARLPYRVVLADDDGLYRCVLKRAIEMQGDLEVAGEAGDGLQLLSLLHSISQPPQMVIIDLSLPHLGGIGATPEIKSAYPRLKVLVLSIHREKEYVRGALSAGADGYLTKEGADTELSVAIERIRHGGTYVSPVFAGEEDP